MMELLPPVGWADVATKRDLDQLEERMDLRFDHLEERMDLGFDKIDLQFDRPEESMNLRFDKVDPLFDDPMRSTQRVVLIAIAASTAFLAVLEVWGPR